MRPILPPTRAFLPLRQFSTTPISLYRQPLPRSSPGEPSLPIPSVSAPHPEIPAYPLGPRQSYHQSNTGLYGTASIRFGNNVSSRNNKSRRCWRPNVHHKRLWSDSLKVFVRTRVTTRVLRTIDKVGGLDAYLLGIKPARVKELGPWGWRLRWRVMQTPAVKEQFAREREALGLGPVVEEEVDAVEGEKLMAETDKMLAGGEEIALGEEVEEGFMREEKVKLRDLQK